MVEHFSFKAWSSLRVSMVVMLGDDHVTDQYLSIYLWVAFQVPGSPAINSDPTHTGNLRSLSACLVRAALLGKARDTEAQGNASPMAKKPSTKLGTGKEKGPWRKAKRGWEVGFEKNGGEKTGRCLVPDWGPGTTRQKPPFTTWR